MGPEGVSGSRCSNVKNGPCRQLPSQLGVDSMIDACEDGTYLVRYSVPEYATPPVSLEATDPRCGRLRCLLHAPLTSISNCPPKHCTGFVRLTPPCAREILFCDQVLLEGVAVKGSPLTPQLTEGPPRGDEWAEANPHRSCQRRAVH